MLLYCAPGFIIFMTVLGFWHSKVCLTWMPSCYSSLRHQESDISLDFGLYTGSLYRYLIYVHIHLNICLHTYALQFTWRREEHGAQYYCEERTKLHGECRMCLCYCTLNLQCRDSQTFYLQGALEMAENCWATPPSPHHKRIVQGQSQLQNDNRWRQSLA